MICQQHIEHSQGWELLHTMQTCVPFNNKELTGDFVTVPSRATSLQRKWSEFHFQVVFCTSLSVSQLYTKAYNSVTSLRTKSMK
jgi:hypothetical protein